MTRQDTGLRSLSRATRLSLVRRSRTCSDRRQTGCCRVAAVSLSRTESRMGGTVCRLGMQASSLFFLFDLAARTKSTRASSNTSAVEAWYYGN
jgi:hypothetical protein